MNRGSQLLISFSSLTYPLSYCQRSLLVSKQGRMALIHRALGFKQSAQAKEIEEMERTAKLLK